MLGWGVGWKELGLLALTNIYALAILNSECGLITGRRHLTETLFWNFWIAVLWK
jgi:hypothetical protein